MKQSRTWLLALLSALTLMATSTLAVAEESSDHFSGSVEIGATVVDVKDNPARAQEYTGYRSDDGVNVAPKLELEYLSDNLRFLIDSETKGHRDQTHGYEIDFKRMLRVDGSYEAFEHWKDHETLDQMGATARDDVGGSQPSVTTDKIMAELAETGYDITIFPGGGVGGGTLPADYNPKEAYEQEVSNDYIVTRREIKSDASLTLPMLPNITFHAGMRMETREGLEQAIATTKCDSCHVTAVGKNIDERTEEYTLGATGKFGLLTVDYEYLTRNFAEDSAAPTKYYELPQNGTAYNLLYADGDYAFARTPDSQKDSHALKARVDLSGDTVISSSYVKSDIESSKAETETEYDLLGSSKLESEYESFGAKLSTKFGKNLRLSLRGQLYQIDVKANEIYYPGREKQADGGLVPDANVLPFDTTDAWHSAEARDVAEFGVDAVYRLSKATTLRLGYEYEEVERDEEELGETTTHTVKAAVKTRFNKAFSGRASYEYQNIDEPFAGAHVGIAQGDGIEDPLGSGLWYYNTADFTGVTTFTPTPTGFTAPATWYWNAVYPNRQLESTSLPEDVHEAKVNVTWAARHNLAANAFARVRYQENDRVSYEQTTYVPGVSLWYAPNGKMNLTLAYTFNKQETENKMCVGWYHG
ncbi:cytochrome c [Desulfuromonas sp. AOP6]|nr:cytochrome c [Desulfuromonas sp. AOP6]